MQEGAALRVAEALLGEVAAAAGVEPRALVLAMARVLPVVLIVPALGLSLQPWFTRLGLAAVLALGLAPALAAGAAVPTVGSAGFLVETVAAFLTGLPVAVSASVALWAAAMVGGLAGDLAGLGLRSGLSATGTDTGPLGALLGLATAALFLQGGGLARLVTALGRAARPSAGVAERVAADVGGGLQLAFDVGAPLLGASLVLETGLALVARSARPLALGALLAPLRPLAIVGVTAVLFERLAGLLATASAAAP